MVRFSDAVIPSQENLQNHYNPNDLIGKKRGRKRSKEEEPSAALKDDMSLGLPNCSKEKGPLCSTGGLSFSTVTRSSQRRCQVSKQ